MSSVKRYWRALGDAPRAAIKKVIRFQIVLFLATTVVFGLLAYSVLHGAGAYSGRAKEVLFCVCKRNQIARLKQIVKGIDPDAFLVVAEAREVLGEGFNLYREDAV